MPGVDGFDGRDIVLLEKRGGIRTLAAARSIIGSASRPLWVQPIAAAFRWPVGQFECSLHRGAHSELLCLRRRYPAKLLIAVAWPRLRARRHVVEVELQLAVGEGSPNAAERVPQADAGAERAAQREENLGRAAAAGKLGAGKLPESAEEPLLLAHAEEHVAASPAHGHREAQVFARWADLGAGVLGDPPGAQGRTRAAHRAQQAGRILRPANDGAKLHQGLVEIPRARAVHQLRRLGPQPRLAPRIAGPALDPEEAGQNAPGVPVDGGGGVVEGNRGDGPGGVAAKSGKLA